MDELLRTKLADEMMHLFNEMGHLKPGTEEYDHAANSLAKLYSVGLDDVKTLIQDDSELRKHEAEEENKKKELKEKRIDRWVEVGKFAAKLVGGSALYAWMFANGLNFEKNGNITSKFFQKLINTMKPMD